MLLYPALGYAEGAKAAAGEKVVLPPNNLWYKLDDDIGSETIYMAASHQPIKDLEGLIEQARVMRTRSGSSAIKLDSKRWVSTLEQLDGVKRLEGAEVATHRGLAGLTPAKPIKITFSSGREDLRPPEILVGEKGLLRKLVLDHQ